MTQLHEFAELCGKLETSPGRLDKLRLVAEFLRVLDAGEVATGVAYLTGRAFPTSEPRVLGVRGLPEAGPPAVEPSLALAEVAAAFAAVAEASGAGSRRTRERRLAELAARATEAERALLWRIITGEMRTGVSDGLVLEAIGIAAGAEPATVRRAALFLGDLSAVAALARAGGADALAAAAPRLFVPLLPMLAEIATDFDVILAAHGGRTALEYKYDGARIQLHRDGDRVRIWTRRLSDVTASLPDVVEIARRELSGAPFILDGEVVALDAAGRPRQALVQAEGRADGGLRHHRRRPGIGAPCRLALELPPGGARRRRVRRRGQDLQGVHRRPVSRDDGAPPGAGRRRRRLHRAGPPGGRGRGRLQRDPEEPHPALRAHHAGPRRQGARAGDHGRGAAGALRAAVRDQGAGGA